MSTDTLERDNDVTENTEQTTQLVVLQKQDISEVFQDMTKMQPILDQVAQHVRTLVPDISTKDGRKEIGALARKITSSRVYLDNLGKDYVAELKALPKKIDENRAAMRKFLDELSTEIRQPLTEWEAEEDRKKAAKKAEEDAKRLREQAIQERLAAITHAPLDLIGKAAAVIESRLAELENDPPTLAFFGEVHLPGAQDRFNATVAHLRTMLDTAREREAAEQRERDRQVAEDATRREREANEQRVRDAQLAQERAERERQQAEARAQAAQEQAERERHAAAEREQRAAEQAAERERQRQAAEEAENRRQAEARAANAENRRNKNRDALADLIAAGISEEVAKQVITAIAQNKVRHIGITY